MRIAFFLDQSFPPDSRVENEAVSLIKAGHEVHLFSLNYKGLTPARLEWQGIQLYRITAGKLLYKSSALAYEWDYYHRKTKKHIKAFIEEVKPEALHVHDMLLAKAVMDVNDRFYYLPLTLDLHENRPEIMQYYPHLQRFPAKYLVKPELWKRAQNNLIKRADHVVLVTPEAIEVAVNESNESPDKFTSVANTILPDIYWNYPIDKKVLKKFKKGFDIVYVGDTGLRRGTDTAIRAMRKVIEQIPQAQLVLVGKSTEDEQLKQLVGELGLSAHVLFEGWQDVSLFPSYIKGAEVCVSPLHRNLHHDTTLANKIFQYMAGARAIVASDCPAQVSVIEDAKAGLIFPAGDADSMAEKLMELYNNPTLSNQLGENGKRAVEEKYNWNITSLALIEHYRSLEERINPSSN